jgi:phosphopantetheinyl transferase (holo-ACP synthase)
MKNNLSTGIDIVSINRIKEILTSSKRERFLKKIFSSNENQDRMKPSFFLVDLQQRKL